MADLKIYNNGENKVLMSAGDRIIRQPYEFGNAFQNKVGLSNYVKILNPDLTNDYESIIITNNAYSIISANTYFNIITSNGNNFNVNSYYGGGTTSWLALSKNGSDVAGSRLFRYAIGDQIRGVQYIFTTINQTVASGRLNGFIGQSSPVTDFSNASTIEIGKYSNIYTNSDLKLNRFVIFNRQLTTEERSYFYNNKIGSNLQSRVGMVLDIIMNKAEILDFSTFQDGSDLRVGCRDYSGFNRHGQIMNLPVGSLEDQLAFANANLFVPFIQ